MIKILIFCIFLTSCSLNIPKKRYKNPKTLIDRKYECVLRLVERNGTGAEIAEKVCDKTFRIK